ncbi:hypothetical protein KQX63_17970 [Rhodopseudomonas palustris]|jgi:predicted component of type VI protein secretion system|uniref:hypothetical protein n=1 Tax=Rhodopseudomonas TaxID=1073 RepID=UPI000D19A84D|nr:hypothetical protein [Rhodopseudomonas palustris]AVT82432.1 hypothetical protein RPYSC3_35720 [Rhodopseudomonas palustris]UYO43255.1 hypothetical protein KQX63_17970 [Rhodopseudomonas palustris]UYO47909.1 hypothetical protein KQX64_18320 [Rhodopseudomonas palustris]UYO52607.1 hypothetical protein KQX61_18700 [Rhodopseudomonas palustris]
MPAFTFEKISPPVRPGGTPPNVEPEQPQPRGVIVRILDRFVQSAVRRTDPNADAHSRFPDKPAH